MAKTNENLNLVEVLKNVPKGTKLWSPLCGECEFKGILSSNNVFQIRVKYVEEENDIVQYLCFSLQGKYCNCSKAECLLFPSKENRDWSTFRITKEHKCFELFHKNMDKTINSNGFDYVDLGIPSGTKWATMNVGASKPSDFGLYFQWGDTVGYTADQVGKDKQFTWSDYKFTIDIDGSSSNFSKYNTAGESLELADDAANANMGGSWHMPSPTQLEELTANTTTAWTTQDGVNGKLFTSKKNGKSIFVPAAGFAWDGSLYLSGGYGDVWSSVLSTGGVFGGRDLYFYSGYAHLGNSSRYSGLSVRGVIG